MLKVEKKIGGEDEAAFTPDAGDETEDEDTNDIGQLCELAMDCDRMIERRRYFVILVLFVLPCSRISTDL